MMRFIDFFLSFFGLLFTMPIMLIIVSVGFFETGSPIFLQKRVGQNQRVFKLIKFRTMHVGAASVATHLVSEATITRFGQFLRKTKLDELPQLWNVLKGEMSLVGPRPCLPEQLELIQARKALDVYKAKPGITGLAQILGVDMSTPRKLAVLDAEMLQTLTLKKYLKLIVLTVSGKGYGDRLKS